MKIDLNVLERLTIINSLSKEGDIVFLRLRKDIIDKTALTGEEISRYDIKKFPDGTVKWKTENAVDIDIEFTNAELGLIKDTLIKLNNMKQLTADHLSLYNKLIET